MGYLFLMNAQEFIEYIQNSPTPITVFHIIEDNYRSTMDFSLINDTDVLQRMTNKVIQDFPNSIFEVV